MTDLSRKKKILTLGALVTEPPDVAVALLGRWSGAAHVDAHALASAVGVVEALLAVLAPVSAVATVAPASSHD